MSNEITLRSAAEILEYFRANPKLTFDQMLDILHAYTGGDFRTIVFRPIEADTSPTDPDRPKRELMQWLETRGKELDDDNGPPPILFTSIFSEETNP